MKMVSPHERLLVYEKALSFVRGMAPQIELWSTVHSVRDQMDRACESVILNLVRAAWHQRCDQGIYLLEPACPATIAAAKALLREVMAMLGGMKGYLESI